MAIRSLRAGRQNYAPETYLGVRGELFYIEETGEFRVCDAVTPGGIPIPLAIASQTVAGTVKLGPGVVLNSEGQIVIDPEGLEFSFGDFQSTIGTYTDTTEFAILQTINTNEDAVIASNGIGAVKVVGDFEVYATDTTIIEALEQYAPIFSIKEDGQVSMLVPGADTLAGAFEIVGNTSGFFHPTNQTGVILHTTGNTNSVNRIYHDAINNYPIVVGRRYNGTIGALENVKAGEVIFRIAGQASTGTDFETFGPAKINWMATEDQGPNNQGGKITIDVTANGTNAFNNVITVVEFREDGVVSSIGFKGNVTVGAGNTLDVTGATVTGLTLGGLNPADVAGTMTGTTIKSTVTGSSLTSVGTLTSLTVSGTTDMSIFTGKHMRTVRDVGVVPDAGSITINFATDSIVRCEWGNGFTVNYSNYTAGSVVKLIAYKTAGTGTDSLSLNGILEANVSSGSATLSGTAGVTNFIEFTCIGTTINTVYAQV